MYVVGSFEHSLFVELAISEITELGFSEEQILAIPLDKRNERPKLFDTMHFADGESFLDLALPLGTLGMLAGGIYGFVLPLGPIIWALIGLVWGSLLGFLIKFLMLRRKTKKRMQSGKNPSPQVFIMIHCGLGEAKQVKEILWTHHALGVGTLE